MENILPARFYDILERAGICTEKQVIILSVSDIQKATKLKNDDILLIKSIVSEYNCPKTYRGTNLTDYDKISTGCSAIDALLHGGFRKGTVTEIYGESGSGKTQLVMQCAAVCSTEGCAYISTENLFPIKRYAQIAKNFNNSDYGKYLFVEHLTESRQLLACVRVRLGKLLSKTKISLIVIDSVAAPFRCEHNCYLQRAEELRELAILLYQIAQEYNIAVICINQVTASFESCDTVLPSLGLVWSNMVTYRLQIKKINERYRRKDTKQDVDVREFLIIVAPNLSNESVKFIITANGVEGLC